MMRHAHLVVDSYLLEKAGDTYSADTMQRDGRVRGLFEYAGDVWVCVAKGGGSSGSGMVKLVQVVNPGLWHPGPGWRPEEYSYAGNGITYLGEQWVITRRTLTLTA